MRRATLFSLTVGLILVALKTGAWLLTGSLSMMSSLADSLLDVIASSLNFVAVRYALQPPDHEHRFGHGKAEELATLAQSTFILRLRRVPRDRGDQTPHHAGAGVA